MIENDFHYLFQEIMLQLIVMKYYMTSINTGINRVANASILANAQYDELSSLSTPENRAHSALCAGIAIYAACRHRARSSSRRHRMRNRR